MYQKRNRQYTKRETDGKVQILLSGRWRQAHQAECWYCGTMFYFPYRAKDAGRYCSDDCAQKNRQKEYDRNRITKRCEVCKQTFKRKPSLAGNYRTCGREVCVKEMRRISGLESWEKYKQKHPIIERINYYAGRKRDKQGRFVRQNTVK